MDTTSQNLTTLLGQIGYLKQLPRTGWLLAGIAHPESIADHSFAVALLTLMLAETINLDWAEQGLAQPIDVGRAVSLALLHDLAESVLTDLPKRSAELLGADVKHAAEERAMRDLMTDIAGAEGFVALWTEYDAASTPEARLVKDADKLEMVQQSLVYERSGHPDLGEFRQGHSWHYSASERLFISLCHSGK